MCDQGVVAMTIAQQTIGRSTGDTARDTDAWNQAEIESVTTTETGSHTEQLKVTITPPRGTSPQPCMTTAAAENGNVTGTSHIGGKAAGVSTKEGGVEPGPIAHPPR